MLKHIDFSTASPTVRLALQKGTGTGNISDPEQSDEGYAGDISGTGKLSQPALT
ncbi:hypothetical protein ECDEC6B_4704 [Escherichia coli DEC6B]|nr:hypothetical protein ECDEC6B_4704 [Escherichia coli DEC6B]